MIRTAAAHDPWRNLRKVDRDEVDFGTVMRRPGGRAIDARVVNISTHGLMIRAEGAFQPGDQLSITLPIIGEITAKVAWALGGRLGGQFLAPIDQSRYAELLKNAYRPRMSWPA